MFMEELNRILYDFGKGNINIELAKQQILNLFDVINHIYDNNDKLEFFAGICCGIPVSLVGSGTWQCEKYHTPQQMTKTQIKKLKQTCD